MNGVECAVLVASNLRSQLRQLQNAFHILAAPGHKLREQAAMLREKVSFAWGIEVAQSKWFPWPTTIAPPGARRLKGDRWWPHGMLGFLGYHVGETQPTAPDIRQSILEYAFEYHLPPLNDFEYYSGWGEPRTAQRLKKLADTLAALARNAKRRDAVSYAKAIGDWGDDLDLLRSRYYVKLFHFGWPTTDFLQ
jgi:hypothetical protein